MLALNVDWGMVGVLVLLIAHLATFVWWASKTNQRMEQAEIDIRTLEQQVSTLPSRLAVMESGVDWIKQTLGRIENKLDQKADK